MTTAFTASEASTPTTVVVDADASVVDSPLRARRETPDLVQFRRRIDGEWHSVTSAQFADEIDASAKGLIAAGVQIGDRVAILSSTRYEWTVLDYAIWRAGAATVSIYETSASDQVKYILSDSATSVLLIESHKLRSTHAEVLDGASSTLRETLVIEDGILEALAARGADVSSDELDARRAATSASDMATLIYTSGTTGNPKGVALTHANFLGECANVRVTLGRVLNDDRSTLLFLPLAHVFARIIAVVSVEGGVTLGHTNDIPNLVPDLQKFQPSFLLSVPRVFEKVFNSAKQKAHDSGKGAIFDRAEQTAIDYSRALDAGGAGLVLRAKHAVFDALVYSKLRAALGGKCTEAIAGGAPLGERLGHFFRGAGIPIYEGYGLSETCAAVTVNSTDAQRIGTVGRPVAGASVRIGEDGEILLKGPMVFSGYWHNDEATAETFDGEWFRTGDIGNLDDGFLTITGRKKEIIVTAGGKNVSPAPLEDSIRAHPLVSQCLVVGDNKPFIGALITLDAEALPGWLERHSMPTDTPVADLTENADLRGEIDEAVATANRKVSKAEGIKKFTILDSDFTVESGEITPTMKLKRNVIHQVQADAIEALYGKR